MPIDQLETTQERKAYMLRLPIPTAEEVRDLAVRLGMTNNAALSMLIREALDARAQK
jgi:hypothetical protein